MSKETALKVVKANLSELEKSCSQSGLQGKATLVLIVNSEGAVKKVSVAFGQGKNKKAEACIREFVKNWRFPATRERWDIRIEISLPIRALSKTCSGAVLLTCKSDPLTHRRGNQQGHAASCPFGFLNCPSGLHSFLLKNTAFPRLYL